MTAQTGAGQFSSSARVAIVRFPGAPKTTQLAVWDINDESIIDSLDREPPHRCGAGSSTPLMDSGTRVCPLPRRRRVRAFARAPGRMETGASAGSSWTPTQWMPAGGFAAATAASSQPGGLGPIPDRSPTRVRPGEGSQPRREAPPGPVPLGRGRRLVLGSAYDGSLQSNPSPHGLPPARSPPVLTPLLHVGEPGSGPCGPLVGLVRRHGRSTALVTRNSAGIVGYTDLDHRPAALGPRDVFVVWSPDPPGSRLPPACTTPSRCVAGSFRGRALSYWAALRRASFSANRHSSGPGSYGGSRPVSPFLGPTRPGRAPDRLVRAMNSANCLRPARRPKRGLSSYRPASCPVRKIAAPRSLIPLVSRRIPRKTEGDTAPVDNPKAVGAKCRRDPRNRTWRPTIVGDPENSELALPEEFPQTIRSGPLAV